MKLKAFLQCYIRLVQRILITIFLTLLYFIGFGITRLAVTVLRIKLFPMGKEEKNTFWRTALGYEENMKSNLEQS